MKDDNFSNATADAQAYDVTSIDNRRRNFLRFVPASIFSIITASIAVAAFRFLRPPDSLKQSTSENDWVNIASLAELNGSAPIMRQIEIERDEGWTRAQAKRVVFVLPQKDNQVLSASCPHQGCAVIWRSSEQDFFCPCHASRFNADGIVQNGPAQTNLAQLSTRINGNVLQAKLMTNEIV